jgi:molybdopterin molybdotransferase
MISYSAALEIIATRTRLLPPKLVALAEAAGGIAAGDIVSAVSVPSFANAAMDGFALRSAEVRGASHGSPVRLAIAGTVLAGQPPPPATKPGEAWEITTGAPMPAGCDAVLPIERAQVEPGADRATLRVIEPVKAGQNRRDAGTDFAPGDRLLRAGERVSPQALMGLAAIGCDRIEVRPAPRVAVITTGSELTATGPPGSEGIIRDTNGPYLEAVLRDLGLPLVARRSVADDPVALITAVDALAPLADLVLTTGGVSAGLLDFVPAAIERMGGHILFHKVAIRPGKPLLFAQLETGMPLFGLPGNPMAVAVGLRFFVLPAIRTMMGRDAERPLPARCVASVRKREGLTFFAKAVARVNSDSTLEVEVLPGQESFRIGPLLRANCWAIVPEGLKDVSAGETVAVAPLMPADFPAAGN